MRYELSDYEWTAIKPMLPNKPRGVRRVNDRRVLSGIFWVLRSGAPWRDLPETYGPRTTCYNRFVRWRRANFGKTGAYYYWISRGIDEREVRANRIRKSVGAENTFSNDLSDFEDMAAELQPLIDKVWRHCEAKGSRGRTATLKVKFNDFEIITRSRSVPAAISKRFVHSKPLLVNTRFFPLLSWTWTR
jgi:hypothetical protein